MLFPLTVSGWGSTIRYKTDVIVGQNGQEVRNAVWQDPLLKFNAAFAIRTYGDIETLQAFFHMVKGREQGFMVKDWSDFSIDRTNIGTGDGADATWQLVKKYTNAIGTYTRTITRPVAGSLSVWVANTLKTITTHYTFSTTTGVITFTGGNTPGVGEAIEASCTEFYVPCRFDTDELDIELLNYWVRSGADAGLIQIPDIPMVEIRE